MVTSWISYLPAAIRSRLQLRPYAQQVIGNSVWLFADKVVRMGVGLFVGVWIARYLGPEQFGQLSYAIAFVALFSPIASLGLDGITVRELVRHPEKKDEILGSVFVLKLMGGAVAFFGVVAALSLMCHEEVQVRWLVTIIAVGMIFQAFDVADLWFQSQVQSRYTVVAKNIAFLSLAGLKVWLIVTRSSVVAFAWAATAEIVLGAGGLWIAFRAVGNAWGTLRPAMVRITSLLKESWPLLLSGLAIMLYMRIDQVMLAKMVGEQAVGLYSAALVLSEGWYIIPSVIVSSTMPYLTEMRTKSEEFYRRRLQQLFTQLVRIACIVAIVMTFLASPLTDFLYGELYAQAGDILAVHVWAAIFVFLGVGSTAWFLNEGGIKCSLYQTILGAISNIALNLYWIPSYGAVGCALATAVSYGISAWISNLLFEKTRKLFKLQCRAMINAVNIFRGTAV